MRNLNKKICFMLLVSMLLSCFAFPQSVIFAEEAAQKDTTALLKEKMDQAVVLLVNSPNAYVQNEIQLIDSTNHEIVPIIKDERTLVPIRFISESFGAQVFWDETTSTVTITIGNNVIELKLGNNKISVNGVESVLDVPAQEIQGRTYVPLRAAVEAVGKKVFWDDRGLIIISDNADLIDPVNEASIIDLMVGMLKPSVEKPKEGTVQVGIDTINADEFFTKAEPQYRNFAPGVIRPDEGTVQVTLRIDRPPHEILGNDWDFVFGFKNSQPFNPVIKNILAIYTPPLPEKGLTFLVRNDKESHSLNIPDFNYTPEQEFNLACTWKAGDKICVYRNGVLLGSIPMGTGLNPNMYSYSFTMNKGGIFNPSKLKISTKALSQEELTTDPAKEFTADADTSLIADVNTEKTTRYKSQWLETSGYNVLLPALRAETQCFTEEESVYYPMVSLNYGKEPKEYTVTIKVRDAYGTAILTKDTVIHVPNDGTYRIEKIDLPELNVRGFYDLTTTVATEGKIVSQWESSIANIPANDTNVKDGKLESYYGQNLPFGYDASIIKKMGASMTRTWVFNWCDLEPIKGTFKWEAADTYVQRCKEAGIEILGMLWTFPYWASERPSDAILAKQPKFYRWKPKNLDDWGNYIYQTVNRYKDYVKYWEIDNEVNFHPPGNPLSFSGTTEEYAEMLKVAYTQAKKADPECQILIAGFAYPIPGIIDDQMPFELTDAKYAEGYYDIYNVHGYSGPLAFKKYLDNLELNRPGTKTWMTEEMPFQIEDEKQRVYSSVETYISFLEHGYEKFMHMGIHVTDVFINMSTQSPTKAYQAVGVLENLLRKCDTYEQKYTKFKNSDIFTLKHIFKRTDGKYLSILGCNPVEANVYISGEIEEAYDIYGIPAKIDKVNGLNKIAVKNILYLVSAQPVEIKNTEITSELTYIANGSFEDNTGDIAAAGLEAGKPVSWTFRETVNDPQGKIRLSDKASTGKYAISISSSGAGSVYIFQDIALSNPGEYKVTAKFRKISGDPDLKAYIAFFDRDRNNVQNTILENISDQKSEVRSAVFTLQESTKDKAAVILGIHSGKGEIVIDDVTLEPVKSSEGNEKRIANMLINPSFEQNLSGWTLRDTTKDPEGKITVTDQAATGQKAVSVVSSGQGSVYLFQDVSFDKTGLYKLTARFKKVSGDSNLTPYLAIFDRDKNIVDTRTMNNVSEKEYTKFIVTFTVQEKSIQKVGIIAGIHEGKGELLVDDITLEFVK